MGYYVDPYIPVLVKASIATSSSGSAPNEISAFTPSTSAKPTGWEINEVAGASRSASHILPPVMNRGYYARVQTIRAAIKRFLSGLQGAQIVSLGAGFDSTYFLLRVRHANSSYFSHRNFKKSIERQSQIFDFLTLIDYCVQDEGYHMKKYIEIDVPDTILKKASAIRGRKQLFSPHLPNLSFKRASNLTFRPFDVLLRY